jgi:DNA-binding GntR family transcriptional regulator
MSVNDLSIERRPLHHALVERLRAMINSGELTAGERIPEQALCERFDVSRTPLREALRILSAEGYVQLTPNRGAAVARLTLQDLEEVFPVMASLEALSGEIACARITDAEIDAITALHEEMVRKHRAHELPDYFRLNQAIHESILEASRNPVLIATHHGLAGRITRARYMANMTQDRWDRAMSEHELILEALTARRKVRLAKILRDHVMSKLETVKIALAESDAEVPVG